MNFIVDLESVPEEQILKILEKSTITPSNFIQRMKDVNYPTTCIRVSKTGQILGFDSKKNYERKKYPTLSFEDYCSLIDFNKEENEMSDLLSDVKNLFSNLDEDTYNSLCYDGQEAVLEFCKKYSIDTSGFLPDKEYYFSIETSYMDVPGGIDPDDIEFEVVAILPNGKRVDVDVSGVHNRES